MKPRLLVLSYTSVVLFVCLPRLYRRDPASVHVRVAFRVLEREPCHSVCLYEYKTLEQRPRLLLLYTLSKTYDLFCY